VCVQTVDKLLQMGASPKQKCESGVDALQCAAESGSLAVFDCILKAWLPTISSCSFVVLRVIACVHKIIFTIRCMMGCVEWCSVGVAS
jgi:hypothetical protein